MPLQKNSNGIRVLYLLSELIRSLGYGSKVICNEGERLDYKACLPDKYKPHTLRLGIDFNLGSIRASDIVVYSKIPYASNTLNAFNVVRYLLNRPIYLTGEPIIYGESDYLVAYSLVIDPHLPQLFLLNGMV